MDGIAFHSVGAADEPAASAPLAGSAGRRLKLWELPTEFHCSIVGTCLSQDELVAALPKMKLKLRPVKTAKDYEVHSFFVQHAATDNPASRYMQKMMDTRAKGDIRRFGRATCENEVLELWEQAIPEGRVASAYWAVMSHGLASMELRSHAHGQVHMLSHHHAGANRYHLNRRNAAERRCQELTEAYLRLQRSAEERISALGRALEQAQALAELNRQQAAAASRPPPATDDAVKRLNSRLDRTTRKMIAERQRARAAEAEVERLKVALDSVSVPNIRPVPLAADVCEAGEGANGKLRGRSILYVGGIKRSIPHLKSAVDRFEATLLHHDGGLEETVRSLDTLVERCDLVCCPVDCISHEACQRTKQLCKRHQKPFVPLRSCSASGLISVLKGALVARSGGSEDAVHGRSG